MSGRSHVHNDSWRARGNRNGPSNRGRGGPSRHNNSINSRLGFSKLENDYDPDASYNNNYKNNRNDRSSKPYGKSRGSYQNSTPSGFRSNESDFVVSIIGFKGGHIGSLMSFLEKQANTDISILETKQQDNEVTLKVKTIEMGNALLRLSGQEFAGNKLIIRFKNSGSRAVKDKIATAQKVSVIKEFLLGRYRPAEKILDLSSMDSDISLSENQIRGFGNIPPNSQFPQVVFKLVKDLDLDVTAIDLSRNCLKTLDCVALVDKYLPNVTQFSFETNNLMTFACLTSLSKSSLKIERLIFKDNPFRDQDILKNGDDINYRAKLTTLFPNLNFLDDSPCKGAMQFGVEDSTGSSQALMELPRSIIGSFFDSESTLATTSDFLTKFFTLYDSDRASLINFYEETALFSLIMNCDSPLSSGRKNTQWKEYFNVERNLKKFTELSTRTSRLYIGSESIISFLTTLPITKHPIEDTDKFCLDAWQLPSLIPSYSSVPTPGAYIHITIHGQVLDVRTDHKKAFDRTFILSAPVANSRSGLAGLPYTIISDSLVLRDKPKTNAWNLVSKQSELSSSMLSTLPAQPTMTSRPLQIDLLAHLPLDQQNLVKELQQRTNLTVSFALQCLQEMNWNRDQAYDAFSRLHSQNQIPPEAFNI